MKWERYHSRFPISGKYNIGPERYHHAHLTAYSRVSEIGRYAPNGIRMPWMLRNSREGA